MTGAIEFMQAWRDICKGQWRCDGCPIEELCKDYGREISDEHIAKLVRAVMRESRKKMDDQEPKTGHWQVDTDSWVDIFPAVNGYRCSECNALNIEESSYCPNCGVKMEGEK